MIHHDGKSVLASASSRTGRRAGKVALALVAAGGLAGFASCSVASQPSSVGRPTNAAPTSVPIADIQAAGLAEARDLVVPLALVTGRSRQLELIGAYADTDRLVFFFHLHGVEFSSLTEQVADAQGPLLYASGSGEGETGDFYYALGGGPHSDASGTARVEVTATTVAGPQVQVPTPQPVRWRFDVRLPVHPGLALTAPSTFVWDRFTVTVRRFEATPSVLHLTALVQGATPQFLSAPGYSVAMLDPNGRDFPALVSVLGPVPDGPLGATLINYEWPRAVAAGYSVIFRSPNGIYRLAVNWPGLGA